MKVYESHGLFLVSLCLVEQLDTMRKTIEALKDEVVRLTQAQERDKEDHLLAQRIRNCVRHSKSFLGPCAHQQESVISVPRLHRSGDVRRMKQKCEEGCKCRRSLLHWKLELNTLVLATLCTPILWPRVEGPDEATEGADVEASAAVGRPEDDACGCAVYPNKQRACRIEADFIPVLNHL
eukprot:2131512-Amphidinium_carterae.1